MGNGNQREALARTWGLMMLWLSGCGYILLDDEQNAAGARDAALPRADASEEPDRGRVDDAGRDGVTMNSDMRVADGASDLGTDGDVGSACAPERPVGTLDDILATLPSAWGRQTAAFAPLSDDLLATQDIELRAERIPFPEDCTTDCEVRVFATGVELEDRKGVPVIVSGTRFRARGFVLEVLGRDSSRLNIIEPCALPCADGARRCIEDARCYDAPIDYCFNCIEPRGDVGESQRCACQDENGEARTNGSFCSYNERAGMSVGGRCVAAVCEAS